MNISQRPVFITIGFICLLMAVIAIVAMILPDIPERAGSILTTILGAFASVLAVLGVLAKINAVGSRVEDLESNLTEVHDNVVNGGMRRNVKQAIQETDQDPAVQETRIQIARNAIARERHEANVRGLRPLDIPPGRESQPPRT